MGPKMQPYYMWQSVKERRKKKEEEKYETRQQEKKGCEFENDTFGTPETKISTKTKTLIRKIHDTRIK